jgi:hypothetical protein
VFESLKVPVTSPNPLEGSRSYEMDQSPTFEFAEFTRRRTFLRLRAASTASLSCRRRCRTTFSRNAMLTYACKFDCSSWLIRCPWAVTISSARCIAPKQIPFRISYSITTEWPLPHHVTTRSRTLNVAVQCLPQRLRASGVLCLHASIVDAWFE